MVSDQGAFHLADEFYRQLFEVQTEKNLSIAMLEARRSVEPQRLLRCLGIFDAGYTAPLIRHLCLKLEGRTGRKVVNAFSVDL
jgi:hypothetical protein